MERELFVACYSYCELRWGWVGWRFAAQSSPWSTGSTGWRWQLVTGLRYARWLALHTLT